MRAQYLHLYQFRGFENLQVEFPAEAKTIAFIGENGCGKTSLLEGLAMILQDTLHAHHDFGQVDWDNALNVNSAYQQGSITIRVQTTKRSYEFSQYLTADRARFISEERVALQLNRDLSIDEQIEHYKTQGELAYSKRYYDKAVKEFLRLEDVFLKENKQQDERLTNAYWVINSAYFYIKNYEKSIEYSNKYIKSQDLKGRGNIKLAVSYHRMGICLLILKESSTAIKAFHDALDIIDVQPVIDVKTQSSTLFNLGLSYLQNKDKNNAKNYFERVLRALEPQPSINTTLLVKTYQQLRKCYGSDQKKIRYYTQLIAQYQDTIIEPSQDVNEPSLSDDNVDVSQFNDYLEVWTPIVLQYTAKSLRIDNYKNTSPIAFDIPMTTNFDLISDWFIEYENDENRKRLRVDPNYRGAELEIIRKVISDGLSLLNGGQEGCFTELQTEIEETVKEGQVNSYLSIKKDGLLLNVGQLSDGEKRVLVLLIDIARRMIVAAKKNNEPQPLQCAGIILIDEPEQHLHPKWQRSFLPTLNHLFPNIQFVVATHSPLVVSNLFHYNETGDLVNINKQAAVYQLTSQAATPIQTAGRDVSNVLGDYFGVERRSSLFQQKIDQLFAAFEEEIIDVQALKKQLDELKKLLGTSDPEVISAEIIIDGLALVE